MKKIVLVCVFLIGYVPTDSKSCESRGGYGRAIESWMPSSDIATGAMVLKSTSLPEISVLLDQARKLTKER